MQSFQVHVEAKETYRIDQQLGATKTALQGQMRNIPRNTEEKLNHAISRTKESEEQKKKRIEAEKLAKAKREAGEAEALAKLEEEKRAKKEALMKELEALQNSRIVINDEPDAEAPELSLIHI